MPRRPRHRPIPYPPAPRRRAEGGIAARSRRGAIGETWWSRRFIEVLESFRMGGRLARGRSYARSGQVMDLEVSRGTVTARVQGSRARPYRVAIAVPCLTERDWRRAEDAMAAQAIFLAKLLAGEMPAEIEEAFAECRLSLFPASRRDLATSCTCPDFANPCKHVAAALYILAERFDEDPFLIFAWRGRPRDRLLENLRLLRADAGEAAVPAPSPEPERATSTAGFWGAGPELSGVRVHPKAAEVPDAILRELDPLPLGIADGDPAAILAPAYRLIAEGAERLAVSGSPGADAPPAGTTLESADT